MAYRADYNRRQTGRPANSCGVILKLIHAFRQTEGSSPDSEQLSLVGSPLPANPYAVGARSRTPPLRQSLRTERAGASPIPTFENVRTPCRSIPRTCLSPARTLTRPPATIQRLEIAWPLRRPNSMPNLALNRVSGHKEPCLVARGEIPCIWMKTGKQRSEG